VIPAAERLLVALLVGLLIGLDRERAEARKHRALFAGVRTFPLIALAGAIPLVLGGVVGAALAVVSALAVAGVAVVSYLRASAAGEAGATTEIAAVTTFLLGALAGAGELHVAAAAGVVVAVLLAAKPPLEAFSRALRTEEVVAVLQLAVVSVIVLPLLPDRGYGPWEVLNPREIWLIVVLVSALSFAGFVLARLFGEGRGLVMTGALGGLVSSTAVTMAMAERSRAGPRLARVAAAGAALASTIMCLRIGVLAGAVNPAILPPLLPVLGAMSAGGALVAWRLARRAPAAEAPGAIVSNPFSLTAALAFGALYALVLLLVRGAQELLGERGLYAAAALAGLTDVDAPAVAFARLGRRLGDGHGPAAAIGIAAVANTLAKLAIAVSLGAGAFRRDVAAALGVMAVAGAAGVALVAWR
jgi:uncharacterized membrane protein (DUF4010 family)